MLLTLLLDSSLQSAVCVPTASCLVSELPHVLCLSPRLPQQSRVHGKVHGCLVPWGRKGNRQNSRWVICRHRCLADDQKNIFWGKISNKKMEEKQLKTQEDR